MKNATLMGPVPEAQPSILGRPMVILSIILHVTAFVAAVGLPRILSLGHAPDTVYTVDLVTLPGLPAASPAPAAAAPAAATPPAAQTQKATPPPPPPVKKAPSKPIILPEKNARKPQPPKPEPKTKKPEPKKPEVKKPEPEKEEEENNTTEDNGKQEETKQPEHPAATTPQTPEKGTGAPQGATGGAGTGTAGTGTGSGDEYDFYIALISRKIKAAWKRPVSTGSETRTAIVRFELSPTGRVLNLELQTPSGFAPLDRSVVQAVHDAEPFPPFPLSLKLDRLKLPIQFELTPGDNGNNPGG